LTGTAFTEAEEFMKIYKLDVVKIPTNRGIARKDYEDLIFMSEKAKWVAIVEQIKDCYERGQPVADRNDQRGEVGEAVADADAATWD